MSIANINLIDDNDLFVVTDGDNGHKSVKGFQVKDLLKGEEPLPDFEITKFSTPTQSSNVITADTNYTYEGNASTEDPSAKYTFYVDGVSVQSGTSNTLDVQASYKDKACYVKLELTESTVGHPHPSAPRTATKDSGTITVQYTVNLEDFEITRFNDPFESNGVVYAGSYQYTGNASSADPIPTYRWFVNGARVQTGSQDTLDILPSYEGGVCYVSLELNESTIGHPSNPRTADKTSNSITLSVSIPPLVINNAGNPSHSNPLNPGATITISGFTVSGGTPSYSYSYVWRNDNGSQVGTSENYTTTSADLNRKFRRTTTVTSGDGQSTSATSSYSAVCQAVPPSVNVYGSWTKNRYGPGETAVFNTTTFNNATSITRNNTQKQYRCINQMCVENRTANWGTADSNLSGSQLRRLVTNTNTSKSNTLFTLAKNRSRRLKFYFGNYDTRSASLYTRQSSSGSSTYYENNPWAIIFYFTFWNEGATKTMKMIARDKTNGLGTTYETNVGTTNQSSGKRVVIVHRTNNNDNYEVQFENWEGGKMTLNWVGICPWAEYAMGGSKYTSFPQHNISQCNDKFSTSISDSHEGVEVNSTSAGHSQVIPEGYFYTGFSESISVSGLGTVKNPSSGTLNTGIQAGSDKDAIAEQIERSRLGRSNASVPTSFIIDEGVTEETEQYLIIPGEENEPDLIGEDYGDPISTS